MSYANGWQVPCQKHSASARGASRLRLVCDSLRSPGSEVNQELSADYHSIACNRGLLTWFAIINENGFQIIWRYFSWSNQTLAMIALWVATAYLLKEGKYRFGSLVTAIPATFMTAVSITYILIAQEGFRLSQTISYTAGASVATVLFAVYLMVMIKSRLKMEKVKAVGE